jgi:hypothetical protein
VRLDAFARQVQVGDDLLGQRKQFCFCIGHG